MAERSYPRTRATVRPARNTDNPPGDTPDVTRRPVPKRVRYEVLRRDNHACRYCGGRAPDAELTVDHVIPVVLGGGNDPTNLVTACRDCNAGKASTNPDDPLVADVAQDALRWARAMVLATQLADAERDERDRNRATFDAAWRQWSADGYGVPRESTWARSVDSFIAAGLSIGDLTDAVAVAMRRPNIAPDRRWRYFCGVVWRTLDQRQRIALDLLAAEETEA